MTSLCKTLERHFGGKWHHPPFSGHWLCDDGRYVRREGISFDDWGRPTSRGSLYLYEHKDKPGKLLYLHPNWPLFKRTLPRF